MITRLCELDPEGESFRYPVSAKRQDVRTTTLDPDLRYLDLGALVAEVVEVIQLLGGADTGVGVDMYDIEEDVTGTIERGLREEFEKEMRTEYAAETRGN